MDNENLTPRPEDWLEEFLASAEAEETLDAPQSIAESDATVDMDLERILQETESAGLTSPEDMELEQIIQETKAASWTAQEAPVSASSGENEDFAAMAFSAPGDFAPQQETMEDLTDQPQLSPMISQETHFFTPEDMGLISEVAPGEDFAPVSQSAEPAAQAPQKEPEETPPPKKRRPEMKKGYGLFGIPHIISTVIWLAIITTIGVTLGRLVWVGASDMLAFNKPFISATITITENDDLDTITEKLENAGLVRYPVLFKAFAQLKGGMEEFSTGTFTFTDDRLYDYNAIINNMHPFSSAREEVKDLVIPEGFTCAQTFTLLEEYGVCTVEELEEYCASGELPDYWFLEGVERGDKYCLEGYLFPNTYNFYKDDSPAHVIGKMLASFDDNYTDIMKERLDPLNQRLAATLASRGFSQEYIDEHKMTVREIVIIASMIERESTDGLERYKVSAVIYNRLTNPKKFPKLQIDATIIYALGGNIDPETGKVKPLTKADLAMDHPYNSYVYDGLIPGPISNPGSASLNAALDPDESEYYFYVYDPDAGEHIFSKTVEEHEKAVKKVNGN